MPRSAPSRRADATVSQSGRPRPRITVVLADDHPIVLAGLETLLRREPDLDVIAQCPDGPEAVRAVTEHRPDVLVLDLRMPRMDGLAVLRQLTAAGVSTRIVLLAAVIDEDSLRTVLRLGVHGIVLKEAAANSLVDCIRAVYDGRQWIDIQMIRGAIDNLGGRSPSPELLYAVLSPREKEVVAAVMDGLRNAQNAARLAIAESTVKLHLHTIYTKLQVQSRTALIAVLRDTSASPGRRRAT